MIILTLCYIYAEGCLNCSLDFIFFWLGFFLDLDKRDQALGLLFQRCLQITSTKTRPKHNRQYFCRYLDSFDVSFCVRFKDRHSTRMHHDLLAFSICSLHARAKLFPIPCPVFLKWRISASKCCEDVSIVLLLTSELNTGLTMWRI